MTSTGLPAAGLVSVAGVVAIPIVSRDTRGTNRTGARSPGTTSSGPLRDPVPVLGQRQQRRMVAEPGVQLAHGEGDLAVAGAADRHGDPQQLVMRKRQLRGSAERQSLSC
jgi:hypothetical protein